MLKISARQFCAAMAAMCIVAHPALVAQSPAGRSDPFLVDERLPVDQAESGSAEVLTVDQRPVAEDGEGDALVVGAIRIDGATALPQSAFAPIVEKYVGRPLDPGDLGMIASEVANLARASGFGLATAWVPKQSSGNGILRIALDEGRIDAIEASGDGAEIVHRTLAPLANGKPVLTIDLERQLLLAGDIAGVRVGKPRLDRNQGRNILRIAVARDKIRVDAGVDNWGSKTIGPVRARLNVDFNGLLFQDDRLTLGGAVTPTQPEEFELVRANYSKAIGNDGTIANLGAYYVRSAPGAGLANLDLAGRSIEAELGLSHPFLRTRATSLWGNLAFRIRDSELDRGGLPIRDDRIATLAVGAYGITKFPDGYLRARLTVVRGLDLLGATQAGDPLASRRDADGTFTKLEFWSELQRRFGQCFSLQAQIQGQLASGPLLSSEEFGLGGRYFLRGYDYWERSGDSGAAASLEFRYDLRHAPGPLSSLQFYGFADAGTVHNIRGGFGDGSLASLGGGVRGRLGNVNLGVEMGVPLKDRFDPENHRAPRVSFNIGTFF